MKKQAKTNEAPKERTLAEQVADLTKQVETLTELVHKGHNVPISTKKEITPAPNTPTPRDKQFEELKELLEKATFPKWPQYPIQQYPNRCSYCGQSIYPNVAHTCSGTWPNGGGGWTYYTFGGDNTSQ